MQALRSPDTRHLDLKPAVPAFLLGSMATSFQVYLLREFSAQFYGNELNYGFVLASWLLWGGLGSLLAGRRPGGDPRRRLAAIYAGLPVLLFICLAGLRFSRQILGRLPGEAVGMTHSFAFSLAAGLLVSFPLGVAFTANTRLTEGDSSRVYFLESLGAAAAGIGVYFVLIPFFSNWVGAGLIILAAGAASVAVLRPRKPVLYASLSVLTAALFILTDIPSQKAAWKPFRLVKVSDTRLGKLQVFIADGQVTFASNGLPVSTFPDPASAEETVHFAMAQRRDIDKVLLIGGSTSGAVAEILKYPVSGLDLVELDPAMIEAARRYLPAAAAGTLDDPRVRIIYDDGRRFIKRTATAYDAVIVSLPEPATAQVNRFFTMEFFLEAKKVMRPNGVLCFTVASAENYISPDLGKFLAVLNRTLSAVFPETAVVPGENAVFLASRRTLTVDPDKLSDTLEGLGIRNSFVNRDTLRSRLSGMRLAYIRSRLAAAGPAVNRDLKPAGYFYHSIWWASQFKGPEAAFLRFFAGGSAFEALDIPLIFLAAVLLVPAVRRRNGAGGFLVPVAAMGMTSIVVEMSMIMVFQASLGYLYGRISLLLGAFMAGLAFGSYPGFRRRVGNASRGILTAVQALKTLLLVLMAAALARPVPEVLPFAFLFLEGSLSGRLFVTANKLYQGGGSHPGAAYGVDLLGSFLGGLAAASLFIPLFGVAALTARLAVLNLLCLAFIVIGRLVPATDTGRP